MQKIRSRLKHLSDENKKLHNENHELNEKVEQLET